MRKSSMFEFSPGLRLGRGKFDTSVRLEAVKIIHRLIQSTLALLRSNHLPFSSSTLLTLVFLSLCPADSVFFVRATVTSHFVVNSALNSPFPFSASF